MNYIATTVISIDFFEKLYKNIKLSWLCDTNIWRTIHLFWKRPNSILIVWILLLLLRLILWLFVSVYSAIWLFFRVFFRVIFITTPIALIATPGSTDKIFCYKSWFRQRLSIIRWFAWRRTTRIWGLIRTLIRVLIWPGSRNYLFMALACLILQIFPIIFQD